MNITKSYDLKSILDIHMNYEDKLKNGLLIVLIK